MLILLTMSIAFPLIIILSTSMTITTALSKIISFKIFRDLSIYISGATTTTTPTVITTLTTVATGRMIETNKLRN